MLSEYNYHTRVMGCDFDMTFVAESVEDADKYFIASFEIAQFYEKKFSRFDKRSELSMLNNKKEMVVSEEFLDVFLVAYNLYQKTQGKFNPLLQLNRIGYDQSFEELDGRELFIIDDSHYNTNMDDIAVSQNFITLQQSQVLDFGGFLKGYVAEKIACSIGSDDGMIINIGGDIYVQGRDHEGGRFVIEIVHPFDEKKNSTIAIENKSLCTSGTYKRRWKESEGESHHIMDANTKKSVQSDVISASVICENGAAADAFATHAVSLGSKKAKEFLFLQGVDFVIMCQNGGILELGIFKSKI